MYYKPSDPSALRLVASGLAKRAAAAARAECFDLAARLDASARSYAGDAERLEAALAREGL